MAEPAIFFEEVNERQGVFHRRAFLLGGFAGAGLLALGGRLAHLQLIETQRYEKLSASNQFNFKLMPPPRGLIVDRNGVVLASNRPNFRLMVARDKGMDVPGTLKTLASFVPLDDKRQVRLAKDIASRDYNDLLVISILKGSFIFAADLIRAMHDAGISPEVEFIFISSYGAGTQSGEVRVLRDIDNDVAGRDVLLIDDILESGKTLKFTRELMLSRGAKSCSIAVLLDKRMRRQTDVEADFVGFDCPDYFVVGYGMDVGHAFRELPFVGHVLTAK